jgi:2'-5' RNA ligase
VALPLAPPTVAAIRQALAFLEPFPRGAFANAHLTLFFLGALPASREPSIVSALSQIASPGFDLKINAFAFFPPERRNILVARPTPSPPLLALRDKMEEALAPLLSLKPSRRPFTPHVTLARHKEEVPARARRELNAFRAFANIPAIAARAFILYQSQLAPEGARHFPLAVFPLQSDSR